MSYVRYIIYNLLSVQTYITSFYSFSDYSFSDGDYMINPEIKYKFSDHVWSALGANIFGGGEKWTMFGQLEKNDNAYLQVRYEF